MVSIPQEDGIETFNFTPQYVAENHTFTNFQIRIYFVNQSLKLLLVLGAVLLNILLCIIIRKTNSVHQNVRILVTGIGLSCLTSSVHHLGSILYTLVQYSEFGTSGWNMLQFSCVITEMPNRVGHVGVIGFPLSLAIERAYATRNHRTYDSQKPVWGIVASVLVFVSVLVSLGSQWYQANTVTPNDKTIVYCDTVQRMTMNSQPIRSFYPVMIGIIMTIGCSLVIALIVWTYRKARGLLRVFGINQCRLSLISRLQLRHSIFLTKMLIPAIIAQQICLIISLASVTTIRFGMNLTIAQEIIGNQIGVNMPALLGYNIIPLVCLLKNDLLYTELVKMFKRKHSVGPEADHKPIVFSLDDQKQHFEALDRIWNQKQQKLMRLL